MQSADDVSTFMSCYSDIEVMLKALERYEKFTGAVRIFRVWFELGLQLEKNCPEVQAIVCVSVEIWHQRRLSLKLDGCTSSL